MTFGQKLQLLRRARGLSQEQLAERLAVSRQAVSKWELDASTPDVGNVLRLSELFGVTTDYLLKAAEDAAEPAGSPTTALPVEEKPPSPRLRRGWGKAAIVCGVAGLAGFFVLWVLSTMLPSQIPATYVDDTGLAWYTTKTGYAFWPFIETYRLEAVFILCCALLAAGAFIGMFLWATRWKPEEMLPGEAETEREEIE